MYNKTTIVVSDKEIVDKARKILESKSLALEDCVLAFLEQVVTDGNFPFEFNVPVKDDPTTEGMIEMVYMARHPEEFKTYNSYNEMVEDILKDE